MINETGDGSSWSHQTTSPSVQGKPQSMVDSQAGMSVVTTERETMERETSESR